MQENKFIYASELKKIYNVTAHYYDLKFKDESLKTKKLKCRNLLEIKRIAVQIDSNPDIVVIMMNPGSSKPADDTYIPRIYTTEEFLNLSTYERIPAKPDNAQYQIMRLMEVYKWDFVRIINLSDLRNGNSGKLEEDLNKINIIDSSHPHSITHKKRRAELNLLSKSKTNKIIIAWGSIKLLEESSSVIMNNFANRLIGINLENPNFFKYASPYKKADKLKWLFEIQEKLDEILFK